MLDNLRRSAFHQNSLLNKMPNKQIAKLDSSNNRLPTANGDFEFPFKDIAIKSAELVDFLKKCFVKEVGERRSVNELMDVSVMG